MSERDGTYVDGLREAVQQEMERDPAVVCFGLDVDDPKAIQGTTRGLAEKFGQKALFHDLRWSDAVRTGYGYASRHLVAERAGAIAGVLPLTFVSSPLLGRSLISAAFSVGGGILADDDDVAHGEGGDGDREIVAVECARSGPQSRRFESDRRLADRRIEGPAPLPGYRNFLA